MNTTVIYKQTLKIEPEQFIKTPQAATILCVQVQGVEPVLWYSFDAEDANNELETKWQVITLPTGHGGAVLPEGAQYLGTYQVRIAMAFVGHVYLKEVKE